MMRTPAAAVAMVVVGATALLTAVCVVAGRLWVGPLGSSTLVELDRSISRSVAGARTPLADLIAGAGSRLGDTLTIVVAFSVVVIVLAALERWSLVALFAAALSVELVVFLAAVLAVGRDRPDVVALGPVASTGSFPSGHTAAAVCLYGGVALVARWCSPSPGLRWATAILAVLVAIAVGLARLYDGQHHLYDVAWGWLLGGACLYVGVLAARAVDRQA